MIRYKSIRRSVKVVKVSRQDAGNWNSCGSVTWSYGKQMFLYEIGTEEKGRTEDLDLHP